MVEEAKLVRTLMCRKGPIAITVTPKQAAEYVASHTAAFADPAVRHVAEYIVAGTIAANPQLPPHDAGLLGAQLADLADQEGDLTTLTQEQLAEVSRDAWYSELEWDLRGHRVSGTAPALRLTDGSIVYRAKDTTLIDASWSDGLPSTSVSRVQWGMRCDTSLSNGHYNQWYRHGVSPQGINYLNNLWRVGVRVVPPRPSEDGNSFSVVLGAESDPTTPPERNQDPMEQWYIVELFMETKTNIFHTIAVTLAALFLNQYPKIWLDSDGWVPPTDASGAELRVAAAILCERLGMPPSDLSEGGSWADCLGGEALIHDFDWAAVFEAVEKAEDVFRGESPQLPAQW